MKLGYQIIAEQMFKKAVVYPEVMNQAKEHLAQIYFDQGLFDLVCQLYREILQDSPKHHIAFELAKVYAKQQLYADAVPFFTMAIDLALEKLLNIEPYKLAEYYMHRASVHEALGQLAESKADLVKIVEADPNFV